jgi:glycosyltransferase involved in cell wall biosynthesis
MSLSPEGKDSFMRQSPAVNVSVVIPCRNEIQHIRAFLDSVFRQELGQIEMEVLIADGMSDDGTRQVLAEFERKYPALRVMDNPEEIISTGANRAIREARGEIIIRMDAHTLYAPDYVRSCVEVLNETGAGNVGGPALTRVDGYLAEAIAHAFHTPFASGGAKYRDPRYEGPVASVPYGCFRKSTFDLVGPYDEDLVCGQDVDLNFRIASSGRTLWQSQKIVSWYAPRTSLLQLFRQHFQYGYWKVAIFRKHRKIVSWRSLVPGSCLLAGIALLLCAASMSLGGSVWWRDFFLKVVFSLAAIYSIASFAVAFSVSKRNGWRFLPVLPAVFVVYQLPYALGSLLALLYRPGIRNLPNPVRKVLVATTR